MSQNAPGFRINFGGGLRHATSILIGSYYLVKDGWKLENPDWLSKKANYPGIPDIYASKTERGVKHYAIIEMESKASVKADAKKLIQFQESTVNHTVYIIHLDEMPYPNDMDEMCTFIKERLP